MRFLTYASVFHKALDLSAVPPVDLLGISHRKQRSQQICSSPPIENDPGNHYQKG